MIDLKNKKILITGATGGIGNALVEKLSSLNADILATGTNEEKLKSLKKEYPKLNIKKFDISIDEAYNILGNLDVLVNNAGVNQDNLIIRMKNNEWQNVIDINLTSTFHMCRSSIKKMLKNKFGRIINITSVVGHVGNIGQSNYSASKGGLVAMSKSLALEYARKNITINCVSPGFIQSKMTENISDKMKEILKSKIPMGRLGSGEDVSNTVAFLSSENSSYITGETIHVNGGMYMA